MKLLKNITLLALIMGFFMSNGLILAEGEISDGDTGDANVDVQKETEEAKEQEAKAREPIAIEGNKTPKQTQAEAQAAALREKQKSYNQRVEAIKSFFRKPFAKESAPTEKPAQKAPAEPEEVSGEEFVMVNHDDANIQRAKIIKSKTPGEIRADDIATWSPEELQLLDGSQINLLTGDQLIKLQDNGNIRALKISSIDPKALADLFKQKNLRNPWSAKMVDQLTETQMKEILKDPNNNIHSYLNGDQLSMIREKVNPSKSLGTKAQEAVANAVSAIKSSRFGKWISDQVDSINSQVNEAGAKRTAGSLARTSAERELNAQEKGYFKDAMNKLTTKEKENVANQWLDSKETMYQNKAKTISNEIESLKQQINKVSSESSPANRLLARALHGKIIELNNELSTNDDQFAKERRAFKLDMQATLKSHEVIIELVSDQKPNDRAFEVLDMKKIDPTKSIDAQYKTMVDNMQISKHTTDTGDRGQISEKAVLDAYSTWVAKKITLNDPTSEKSITDQLDAKMFEITNKTFEECDPSIRKAILNKLTDVVQEKYTIEKNEENEASAGEMFNEAEQRLTEQEAILQQLLKLEKEKNQADRNSTVLTLSPAEIAGLNPEVIPDVTAKTIAKLSLDQIKALTVEQIKLLNTKQVQALTDDQVKSLTTTQINNLRLSDLTAPQVSILIGDLSDVQIKSLSAEQISEIDLTTAILNANQIAALAPRIESSVVIGKMLETLSGSRLLALTSHLSPEQVKSLTSEQIKALTPEQYQSLNVTALAPKDIESAMSKLSISQMRSLTRQQVDGLDFRKIDLNTLQPEQIGALAPKLDDINTIEYLLPKVTGARLMSLLSDLPKDQVAKITDKTLQTMLLDLKTKGDGASRAVENILTARSKAKATKK